MSYYEKTKLDNFKEKFVSELKLYEKYKERETWISAIDNIKGVQNMSPEVMALASAYLTYPISRDRFEKASGLDEEFANIEDTEKFIEDINNSIKNRRFYNETYSQLATLLYTSNIDDKIISDIIKNTQSGSSSELAKWPFGRNKLRKLKLKIELSAYIYNILSTYPIW